MSQYLQVGAGQKKYLITNMKRSFHKDDKIQERMVNRSFSNYESKSTMNQSCPQSPFKKTQSKKIVLDTLRLLNYFYKEEGQTFYNIAYNFLKIDWQKQKKRLQKYLNQLCYIEESMKKNNFTQIEQQLIKQWRKNTILYTLRSFWYTYINYKQYKCLQQFIKEYLQFAQFTGQLALLYYKNFFSHIQANNKNTNILDRLTERSSHLIITHTSTWCKFYTDILEPLIKKQFSNSLNNKVVYTNKDIQNLQVPYTAVDKYSLNNQLPNTTQALIKFTLQPRLLLKINILKQVRQSLQSQIHKRQTMLIEKGKLQDFKIVDKDDLIDCLIYCVAKDKISVQKINNSLKYFEIIFGDNLPSILSSYGCGSYFTDLQVVCKYLSKQHDQYSNKINSVKS